MWRREWLTRAVAAVTGESSGGAAGGADGGAGGRFRAGSNSG